MLVLGINDRIWSDRFSEVIDVNNKNTSKNVIFVIIGIFRQTIPLQWLSWFNVKSYEF